MKPQIRVLVVDDSAFMRKSLAIMLESDPDIQVIGSARDGEEGCALVKKLSPDIVTLDIEMPKMDGLTALKKIMAENPTPVIMISSLTNEGAEATIKAFEYGAVDFIPKELSYVNINIIKIKEELTKKIKAIYKQHVLRTRLSRLQSIRQQSNLSTEPSQRIVSDSYLKQNNFKAIAMGISTGGPLSLQKVLPKITKNINCPIFLVQHMPPKFTASLAVRLNSISELEVKEAADNDLIKNNVVYIAPGGFHMTVKKNSMGSAVINISTMPDNTLHRPSVDVMVESVAGFYGKNTLGVIMTGMGKDGLEGIKKIKELGGSCIAQDETSCVVYGMPKAIVDAKLADVIAPLEKIPDIINKANYGKNI